MVMRQVEAQIVVAAIGKIGRYVVHFESPHGRPTDLRFLQALKSVPVDRDAPRIPPHVYQK
jgi:hypothetical protein